ncbi:MAG: hypothetical protein JW754_04040 [Candidatus Aenigmarchaeota archaeon]|nr:hypothetical protein [Candidatus Aenigmarchaeota archaeon]
MHKKKIKNITYYYTSTRENGKVKTIYLGKDVKSAKKKEKRMNGNHNTFMYRVKLISVITLCLLVLSLGMMQMTGMFSGEPAGGDDFSGEVPDQGFSACIEFEKETNESEGFVTIKSYYYGLN